MIADDLLENDEIISSAKTAPLLAPLLAIISE